MKEFVIMVKLLRPQSNPSYTGGIGRKITITVPVCKKEGSFKNFQSFSEIIF
jgi:hypothetical protein